MDIVNKPINIFCCYARNDQLSLLEFKKHLSALEREKLITLWADININAGAEWEEEIDRHLNTAQIILLLVSSDFIDSDYCYSVEMQKAMQQHKSGEARIIPIILRPVLWEGTPFGKIQALPTDAKPIMTWKNLDEAFCNVAKGVKEIAEVILAEEQQRQAERIRQLEEAKQRQAQEQARRAEEEQQRQAEAERVRQLEEAKHRQAQEQARRVEEEQIRLLQKRDVSPPLQQRSPSIGAVYPINFGPSSDYEARRAFWTGQMLNSLSRGNLHEYTIRQAQYLAEQEKWQKNR
jgi:hypothetical protein